MLVVAVVLVMAAAGCSSPATDSAAGPGTLQAYTDSGKLFSLAKPASWTFTAREDVQVKEPAAGGARVVFRPLFLSGSYRSLTAPAIANYLVG